MAGTESSAEKPSPRSRITRALGICSPQHGFHGERGAFKIQHREGRLSARGHKGALALCLLG